jgi:beta-glucosidase
MGKSGGDGQMSELQINRRALGGLALGGAALSLGACAPAVQTDPQPKSRQFPKDFVWGVATAAFQIEGSQQADGRGKSIWDTFERQPGKIVDGSDASIATDSYRRYGEDIDLIKAAGLGAYRFSMSWPRIFPTGEGPLNTAGLDYYERLVDGLLAKDIVPYATLFHWDLPQALQDKGGWANRDTALRLADYAAAVGQKLGDRLKRYIVLNEAAAHSLLGHLLGIHAPGLKDPKLLGPVVHHMNLGQGLAIQALRAGHSDLSIGTTFALQPVRPSGGDLAFWNRPAADGLDALANRAWLEPALKGTYPKLVSDQIGKALKDGDLTTIHQPVDFVGVNYYAPTYVRLDLTSPSKIALAKPPKGVELDAFGRHIDPSGLVEVLDWLRNDYDNPPVMITESGCSDPFSTKPAIIKDTFRITYLRRHLEAALVAKEAGSPLNGYFVWTLLDNFEWNFGYTSKFGLVAHDRATGQRTLKESYGWFANLAKTGTLPTQP